MGREPADLPVLLAPVVFEGAAMHRPAVKLRSGGGSGGGSAEAGEGGGGGGGAAVVGLEVSGPLPPWSVHRMVRVLQQARLGGPVQVQLDSEPSCQGLNVACAAASSSRAPAFEGGAEAAAPRQHWAGTCSAAEASAVQAAVTGFQKRVIKGVEVPASTDGGVGSLTVRFS